MHYYLYFPRARGITDEHLARCGLSDLARDKSPVWFELDRGPDGGPGLGCTWQRGDASDGPLALLPSQEWTPCRPSPAASGQLPVAKGAYWVGLDRARPPRPVDLERKEIFAGYWIELGDHQKWHCPSAPFLPHRHGLDAEGNYARQIDAAFAPFWEASQKFAEIIFQKLAELNVRQAVEGKKAPQAINADFELSETFSFAVQALAFNYRINSELATQLKLFTDDALRSVVKAAIDLPNLLDARAQKKTSSPPPVSIPVG